MTSSGTPESLRWRKATHSGEVNCVEIAEAADGTIYLRNSNRPASRPLVFNRDEIWAFILGAKAGEFDDLM